MGLDRDLKSLTSCRIFFCVSLALGFSWSFPFWKLCRRYHVAVIPLAASVTHTITTSSNQLTLFGICKRHWIGMTIYISERRLTKFGCCGALKQPLALITSLWPFANCSWRLALSATTLKLITSGAREMCRITNLYTAQFDHGLESYLRYVII